MWTAGLYHIIPAMMLFSLACGPTSWKSWIKINPFCFGYFSEIFHHSDVKLTCVLLRFLIIQVLLMILLKIVSLSLIPIRISSSLSSSISTLSSNLIYPERGAKFTLMNLLDLILKDYHRIPVQTRWFTCANNKGSTILQCPPIYM